MGVDKKSVYQLSTAVLAVLSILS